MKLESSVYRFYIHSLLRHLDFQLGASKEEQNLKSLISNHCYTHISFILFNNFLWWKTMLILSNISPDSHKVQYLSTFMKVLLYLGLLNIIANFEIKLSEGRFILVITFYLGLNWKVQKLYWEVTTLGAFEQVADCGQISKLSMSTRIFYNFVDNKWILVKDVLFVGIQYKAQSI